MRVNRAGLRPRGGDRGGDISVGGGLGAAGVVGSPEGDTEACKDCIPSAPPLLLHPHLLVPSPHSSSEVNALLFLWSKVLAGLELGYYPPRLPKTEGRKGEKGFQRHLRCGSFQVRAVTSQQQTPSLHNHLSFLSPAPGTTAELLRACRSICTGAVQTHVRAHTHMLAGIALGCFVFPKKHAPSPLQSCMRRTGQK